MFDTVILYIVQVINVNEMIGKIVLITGASSGMGKATAKILIEKGYTVYCAARRTEMMADLEAVGGRVLQLDIADDDSVKSCVDSILRNETGIDILINNAGFGLFGALEDVSMKDARYQMEVNVFGLARLTQLVLPLMRHQGSGKIVNVTSTGGKLASPLGAWYHASKFAVEALSDSLRIEVRQFGIDVIVIEPGAIKSEWGDIAMESMRTISVGKAYGDLAERIIRLSEKLKPKNEEPGVIGRLILKAITAEKPRTRYYAGYMAGFILFLKKVLSDRQFDGLMLSQMK